ncbi:hypothetical protein [Curtobacterium sp. 260]|uniref:hypothetical protein n=1 Tax=Curtobacterium sp. 260 TaxID=2817748 RepID=UPI002781C1E5|nr:hypothetical protein [Curtobacterium sp. 260]MDP9737793.1 hypothetical protein [Curtobacterium sp. 260]
MRTGIVVTAMAVLALSGCSAFRTTPSSTSSAALQDFTGGHSIEQARNQLSSIEGLSDVSIEETKTVSGLNEHHEVSIAATVEDASAAPAFVDQLAQLGWSVNEAEPDTGVFIRLRTSPQLVIGDVAKERGWSEAAYTTSTAELKQLVLLSPDELKERFGPWPGEAP